MIYNIQTNLQTFINECINRAISQLPTSFPCQVLGFSNGIVKIQTLLIPTPNDTPLEIPALQSPYLTLPIQAGDIGIALNCDFLFDTLITQETLKKNVRATQKNGLFFIPLLPASKQNLPTDITITTPQKNTQIIANDSQGVSITINKLNALSSNGTTLNTALPIMQENTPIDISGSGGSLGSAISIIFQLLDALASGMTGQTTNPTAYNTLKATAQPQINAIIKP